MMSNRFFRYLAKERRSRGYGVHSPFAFAFLMNVLNERKAVYYAYAALDALSRGRRERHENRLIYRVLSYINPSEVALVGGSPGAIEFAVGNALPRALVKCTAHLPESLAPLTIVSRIEKREPLPDFQADGCDKVVIVRELASSEANRIFFNELRKQASFGMAFYDRNIAIFVSRKGLPRQDFAVFMR